MNQCHVVVARDDVAQSGETFFYTLNLDTIGKRVANMLELLICGGVGKQQTLLVA